MDLDSMLKELGQFGKYQALCFAALLFPLMLSGFRCTEYIFTTMNIPHRCRVPECEGPSDTEYEPSWLPAAVPFTKQGDDSVPHECLRYRPVTPSAATNQNQCYPNMFNHTDTFVCNDWIFSEPTRTMATDFKLLCPEDHWKLTLLSNLSVIPSFICMPLIGLVSDRLGRKTILVFGYLVHSITGIIRSLSVSYVMTVIVESVDGTIRGTIHGPAFILGLEILSPSKRLLGSVLIHVYFALGEAVLALIMWATADWRLLLRTFYYSSLILLPIHWFIPESVRWLYTQRRLKDIEKTFNRMAKMNKTEDKIENILSHLHQVNYQDSKKQNGFLEKSRMSSKLKTLIKSRVLMFRILSLAICWISSIFTYYGISQYTTYFESSNRYVSFLLVSLVEVPAYVASLWLPDWPLLGRQGTIAWSFFVCSLSCLTLVIINHGEVALSLVMFLTGKFAATLCLTVLYVYTAEVFPTELRQTLLSICSMIGRLGSVVSQQTPLFSKYLDPMILFSLMAILGGIMTMACPETLNTKLPDTIEEAEQIGKLSRRDSLELQTAQK